MELSGLLAHDLSVGDDFGRAYGARRGGGGGGGGGGHLRLMRRTFVPAVAADASYLTLTLTNGDEPLLRHLVPLPAQSFGASSQSHAVGVGIQEPQGPPQKRTNDPNRLGRRQCSAINEVSVRRTGGSDDSGSITSLTSTSVDVITACTSRS